MRKKNLLLILLTILLISQQFDVKSDTYWNGQTFFVELPGGGQKDYLLKAAYSLFIPAGTGKIRGILIHQHGCGGEGWGAPMVQDAQYQAFAKKWGLAILGPDLFPKTGKNCYDWVNPEDGSAESLFAGIDSLARISGHEELIQVPWLLWGHSGGGRWVLGMLKNYPARIIAAFAYSPAFDPSFEYPVEALKVPVMIRHAGENDFNIPGIDCWGTALHTFSKLRGRNGFASIAYNRGQNHNFSYVRYMALPFYDAVLRQRLRDSGSELSDMDEGSAWLVDTVTNGEPGMYQAITYKGDVTSKSWLPDSLCAAKFREYIITGTVKDDTPPPAPCNLKFAAGSPQPVLSWEADADIESGIKYFKIYINNVYIARYPEGTDYQGFDTNGDIPVPIEQPGQEFKIPNEYINNIQSLSVSTVNHAGLESLPGMLTITTEEKDYATLFLSPGGDDTNPGTLSKPFATLFKARDTVRKINKNMTGNIRVLLRGGYHMLDSAFKLYNEDSGTNGYKIIYQAFNCENAVISGGIIINGWELHDQARNIYKTSIDKTIDTRQLYVNGRRAVRARSIDASGWTENGDGYDCPSGVADWKNISNVEVVSRKEWKCHRGPIASVSGTHAVMAQPYWDNLHQQYDAPPAWIENAFELLDSSGEWYLDRSEGFLYYIPEQGESIENAEIVLPVLDTLIYASGVRNVEFNGLTFSYATWTYPNTREGYPCVQGDVRFSGSTWVQNPGNIILNYCNNISFGNNTFEHLGLTALQIYTGCKNNLIVNNIFQDISGSAVSIGNILTFSPNENDLVRGNTIENNLIRDVAVEYESSVGIFAPISEKTVIKHNDLRNLPHIGISSGWGWRNSLLAGKDNEICYNLIDSVVTILRDGGGIYTLSNHPGGSIHNNYIRHFFNGFGALYPDMGTSNMRWHHNVISDAVCWLSLWSEESLNDTIDYNYSDTQVQVATGKNCVVENNSFIADGNWPPEAESIIQNAGRINYPGIRLPKIFRQSGETSIAEGSNIEIGIIVENKDAYLLNYQWYRNGNPLDGGLGASYYIDKADSSDAGEYCCVIESGCGTVNSDTFNIRITPPNGLADEPGREIYFGQAAPNPASDILEFDYSLPISKDISFVITDSYGREIKTYEGNSSAGISTLRINPKYLGLVPGIYFCTLRYGLIFMTRAFIVI